MIDYLRNNAEWIFSGIGVSILMLLYVLIRALLRKKALNDSSRVESINGVPILDILPSFIVKEISSAPILQQQILAEHYKGITVRWETTLGSARIDKGNIARLMLLDRGHYPWILCDVSLEQYPELRILKESAKIVVSGKIAKVEGNTITLSEVGLEYRAQVAT